MVPAERTWSYDASHYTYKPRSHEITDELRRLRPQRGDATRAVSELDRLLELVREQWRIHS